MICDFGMAKIIEEVSTGLTTTGRSIGTVRYTSPEIVMDDDYIHTLQSDIWAWGCMAFQVSGQSHNKNLGIDMYLPL